VSEIKEIYLNLDSKSNSENIGKKLQIIDADPTVIIVTATIELEELIDPEEGDRLFHSQMWVQGTLLHFIVDCRIQKKLI
jgi:hypothetical protein